MSRIWGFFAFLLIAGIANAQPIKIGVITDRVGVSKPYSEPATEGIVFGADELYLQAAESIPPAAAYEGFPVVEDGIGLVRRFEDGFVRGLRRPAKPRKGSCRTVTVVTGEMFAPVLSRLLERLVVPGLNAEVVAVANDFFGRAIAVAGLLTGEDIAKALTSREVGDVVLVPGVALQEASGVFLDDVSPQDLSRHLNVSVETPDVSARGLLDALLGRRAVART